MTVSQWNVDLCTPQDDESPRMADTTSINRTTTPTASTSTTNANVNHTNGTTACTNHTNTISASKIINVTDSSSSSSSSSSTSTSSFSFSLTCPNNTPTLTTTTTTFPVVTGGTMINDTQQNHHHHHHHDNVGTIAMTENIITNTATTTTNRYQQHRYYKENVQQHVTRHHHHRTTSTKVQDVVDLTQSPSTPYIAAKQNTTTTTTTAAAVNTQMAQPQQLFSSSKICNPYQKKMTPKHSSAANHSKRPLDAALTTTGKTSIATTLETKAFIGGAEMARKKARHDLFDHWKKMKKNSNSHQQTNRIKGPPTRILRPGETKESIQKEQQQAINVPHQNKQQQQFHTYKNHVERFFHAVLHFPISEYINAANAAASSHHHKITSQHHDQNRSRADIVLWEKMCHCLKLDISDHMGMIQATYPDLVSHCNIRTAALIEEVRNGICVGVEKIMSKISLQNHSNGGSHRRSNLSNKFTSHSSPTHLIQMDVSVISMEECGAHHKKNNNSHHQHKNDSSPTTNVEPNHKIMVQSAKPFTKRELYNIRPHSVFLIRPRQQPTSSLSESVSNTSPMVFGVVMTGNGDMVEKFNKFEIMIFNQFDLFASRVVSSNEAKNFDKMFTVTFVTQLVTEFRCFEALNTNYPIHFEAQLIGHPEQLVTLPSPTHTRFKYDDSDDDENHCGEDGNSSLVKVSSNKVGYQKHRDEDVPQYGDEKTCNEYFNIPKLNKTQQDVATQFLQSSPNTITLVQGPPGTGKTTLLVSILCRYLIQSLRTSTASAGEKSPTIHNIDPSFNYRKCHGRIMVCAPTNKAVYVLASRFMKAAMQQQSANYCKDVSFNVILVGDAEKIFMDDRSSRNSKQNNDDAGNVHRLPRGTAPTKVQFCAEKSALKSIFLYTWISSVLAGYERILAYFSPKYNGTDTIMTLLPLSKQLQQRLLSSLPHLPPDLIQRMNGIVASLQSLSAKNTKSLQSNNIRSDVQKYINDLKKLPNDVVLGELLDTANVIFCTLASAGNSVVKKTAAIDDLIVDEAAAATEPELYIPFHLKPKRLLAVGDPLQLQATVLSRRANAMGYSKSLHERLMYDCKYDHIMLDVQYRMNPEISSFPSASFYENKIQNGENVMNSNYANKALLLDRKPYTFLQVEGDEEQQVGGSYCNRMEATIIVDMIANLRRITAGTASPANDCQSWCGSDRVRVITFYQAQVSCIQKCLEDRGLGNTVLVATVDSSQGCEADIVLISFVRSQGGTNTNDECNTSASSSLVLSQSAATRNLGAGFLTDDRRMNVSLTRAKYQLICVGNVRQFPQMPNAETLHQLTTNAEERGIIDDNYSTRLHRHPPKNLQHSFCYT